MEFMAKKPNSYTASLKGMALLIAIDTGLIKRNIFGKTDITPFMHFWEDFSFLLEECLDKGDDFVEPFKDEGDGPANNQ